MVDTNAEAPGSTGAFKSRDCHSHTPGEFVEKPITVPRLPVAAINCDEKRRGVADISKLGTG
jgi:hypothetical protein